MFKFKRFRGSMKIYQKLFYDSEYKDMPFFDIPEIFGKIKRNNNPHPPIFSKNKNKELFYNF